MAAPAPEGGKPVREKLSAKSTTDPILRNALRYTISAKEYETLHKYILSRSKVLKRNTPTVSQVEKYVAKPGRDDQNAAAVRAAVRVFIATAAGLKAWAIIKERVMGARRTGKPSKGLLSNLNFRLSISLSAILLFHRLLFRFFTRLRAHLLTTDAKPFRKRNPRTSKLLTSKYAPAVGASLSGFLLGIYPPSQLRTTVAMMSLQNAAEATYNTAEDIGWLWGKPGSKWERPWWFGSWMVMPLAFGQLLHSFVFDRDCFPRGFDSFIMRHSPQYLQQRPADYPANLPWPTTYDIVDKMAEVARLNYPPFTSPILFPNSETLPPSLRSISPITSSAHPIITSLSCALLHPEDPSCLRTYLTYWIRAFTPLARIFTIVLTLFSIPRYKSFYNNPITSLDRLARRILRVTTMVAGSIGTSWGAICFFQQLLKRNVLATQRFFLGGFLGGLWAYLEKDSGRGNFLYTARLATESLWRVGVKRRWWKGVKGGDVYLFVMALATINIAFTRDRDMVSSGMVRRTAGFLRGENAKVVKKEEVVVEQKDDRVI